MTGTLQHPVLILGATGSLGARTVRMLRKLHPALPITIAARDMDKAAALEMGGCIGCDARLHQRQRHGA